MQEERDRRIDAYAKQLRRQKRFKPEVPVLSPILTGKRKQHSSVVRKKSQKLEISLSDYLF